MLKGTDRIKDLPEIFNALEKRVEFLEKQLKDRKPKSKNRK